MSVSTRLPRIVLSMFMVPYSDSFPYDFAGIQPDLLADVPEFPTQSRLTDVGRGGWGQYNSLPRRQPNRWVARILTNLAKLDTVL